jgi:hypothetical protein
MAAVMRRAGGIVKLEIIAEHVQKMLFQPHNQRMHPGVENHIRAFKAHLRRMAGGEILHMDRGRDHSAGNAQPLADVPFHLRAQDQFRLQRGDGRLHLQIIVGDQRLDPEGLGGGAQGAIIERPRVRVDEGVWATDTRVRESSDDVVLTTGSLGMASHPAASIVVNSGFPTTQGGLGAVFGQMNLKYVVLASAQAPAATTAAPTRLPGQAKPRFAIGWVSNS